MAKARANPLSTVSVEKSQLYALLVDSSGNPVLDESGYEQVIDLQSVGGRLKVDPSFLLTSVIHTSVQVTVGSTAVLVANPNRKYLLLENDSDADIYISINGAAVVGQGIRLNANGGSYEMTAGNISAAAINGINNGVGNKNLLVTEGV